MRNAKKIKIAAGVAAVLMIVLGTMSLEKNKNGIVGNQNIGVYAEEKTLSDYERIDRNQQIAEEYYDAYDRRAVKEGSGYSSWVFADDATYWSPYFGMDEVDLSKNPVSVTDSAKFEALSYSIEFPDWGPVDFEVYPAIDGVAWKTHFAGHQKDSGEYMDFFAYSYVDTNELGEITHWETHVNSDYNDFLDAAIGIHGPFKNGSGPYMQAVYDKLKEAGIDIEKR